MNKRTEITSVIVKDDILQGLKDLGVKKGSVLEVHSSLSSFGYVVGGAQSVVDALLEVLDYDGTLVMPAQSSDNTDPSGWVNPPIRRDLYDVVRENTPAFNVRSSETRHMGAVVDNMRRREGVVTSSSASCAYCSWGKYARLICGRQPIHFPLGEDSPTSHLYDLNADCLLLGVDYDNATCMHLAEYRSAIREVVINAGAMEINGKRVWKKYLDRAIDSDIFVPIGKMMEDNGLVNVITIGNATCKLFKVKDGVDFARAYFESLK